MEDLSTTATAYTKDELAAMIRHYIAIDMLAIEKHLNEITSLYKDDTDSIQQKRRAIADKMSTFAAYWQKFGPAQPIARRLYPEHSALFDVLDKQLSVEDAIVSMQEYGVFNVRKTCDKACCRKQISSLSEQNGN